MDKENQDTASRDAEIFDYLGLGDSNDDIHVTRKKIVTLNVVAGLVTFLVLLLFLWFVFVNKPTGAYFSAFFLIVPLMLALGIFLIVWQGNYRPGKKVPVADGIAVGLGFVLIVAGAYTGNMRQGVIAGLAVWGIRLVRKIIDPYLLRFIAYLQRLNKEIETQEKQLNWAQKIVWYTGKGLVLAVVYIGKAVALIFRFILEILGRA